MFKGDGEEMEPARLARDHLYMGLLIFLFQGPAKVLSPTPPKSERPIRDFRFSVKYGNVSPVRVSRRQAIPEAGWGV
jgi:hypothetical protein